MSHARTGPHPIAARTHPTTTRAPPTTTDQPSEHGNGNVGARGGSAPATECEAHREPTAARTHDQASPHPRPPTSPASTATAMWGARGLGPRGRMRNRPTPKLTKVSEQGEPPDVAPKGFEPSLPP